MTAAAAAANTSLDRSAMMGTKLALVRGNIHNIASAGRDEAQ